MKAPLETPPGECPQCWQHAHDPNAHRHLGPREDCQACIACKTAGHPGTIPKQSRWW
jgi:hypothetical protein